MPRTETILRAFVASPNDLMEERSILEAVIQELNYTWSQSLGIRIELVGWETHTYPAFGVDAQSVINNQIADDYDIFIGLMWARFGTATGRAGSGTAEEFYRAYKRHQENPDAVRIMFYFKNAPIAPSDLDPEQLALIKKFQKELGDKGGYYWNFTGKDEFAQLARMHLGKQVQEWGRVKEPEPSENKIDSYVAVRTDAVESARTESHDETDDGEGYFDLLETGQDSFELMNEAVTRIAAALNDLGARTGTGVDEINKAKSPTGGVDIKHAKKIMNRVAEALNNFAALMEVDVPNFASSYMSGMEAYSKAFSMNEFDKDDKEDLKKAYDSVQMLLSTIEQVKSEMRSFRETTANTPRATTMYNRAKKRALSILDKLDEEFASALNLASEMQKTLSRRLSESQPEKR